MMYETEQYINRSIAPLVQEGMMPVEQLDGLIRWAE